MKYQVSVLSDKGVKKPVATIEADRFEEQTEPDRKTLMPLYQTRLRFYNDDDGWFGSDTTLVASVTVNSAYVVEQVSL